MSKSADKTLRIYTAVSSLIAAIFGQYRTKLFFEKAYWRWQRLKEGELSNAHYAEFFTSFFGLTEQDYSGKQILDVGCGPRGSLDWAHMAKQRVGLDPLADSYKKINPKLQMDLVKGSAEAMPFADESFDVVSCFNALDHVDDLQPSLKEIHRVLKEGGQFLLVTDIHDQPAVCEPTVIQWELSKELSADYEVLFEAHYQRLEGVYSSLRAAIPFDSDGQEAYGLLVLQLRKKAFS